MLLLENYRFFNPWHYSKASTIYGKSGWWKKNPCISSDTSFVLDSMHLAKFDVPEGSKGTSALLSITFIILL